MKTVSLVLFLLIGLVQSSYSFQLSIEARNGLQQSQVSALKVLEQLHISAPLRLESVTPNPETKEDVITEFIKGAITTWDPARLVFLKSDYDEFLKNKENSNFIETLKRGDIRMAEQMADRYVKRLTELRADAVDLLQSESKLLLANKDINPYSNNKKIEDLKPSENASDRKDRLRVDLKLMRLADLKSPFDKFSERMLARFDVQEVNDQVKENEESIIAPVINSYTHLFDPHTDYMPPQAAKAFEEESMGQHFFGIGVVLGYEKGEVVAEEVMEGGPADKAGNLFDGDRILEASKDGKTFEVLQKLDKAVKKIRGPESTKVYLKIRRGNGKLETITIVRGKVITVNSMASGFFDPKSKVGHIYLPSFYQDCGKHVEQVLEKIKAMGPQGIVLNLRDNGGGLLSEAVKVVGLFIKTGPVVMVGSPKTRLETLPDDDPKVVWGGPLMVLTSRRSASASEIVAAALQDHKRAVVLGDEHTWGKGSVQNVIEFKRHKLPGDGLLKVTIQGFFRVTGVTTQGPGVTSDVVLPAPESLEKQGEAYLKHSLKISPVSPTTRLDFGLVDESINTKLRSQLQTRLTEDPWNKELFKFEKDEDNVVSLENFKKRQDDSEIKAKAFIASVEKRNKKVAAVKGTSIMFDQKAMLKKKNETLTEALLKMFSQFREKKIDEPSSKALRLRLLESERFYHVQAIDLMKHYIELLKQKKIDVSGRVLTMKP